MLPTQECIDSLGARIEQAFTLRCSEWYRGCSTPRIWTAAAAILWQTHEEDADIPLDPELFVASQGIAAHFADPWSTLAHPDAGRRYRRRVHRIVRRLRAELRREIKRAEGMVREGRGLANLMRGRDRSLSPLGLYITAHRAGRPDLADQVSQGAVRQHQSCPLYRLASGPLLAAELYPEADSTKSSQVVEVAHVSSREAVLLN